MILIERTRTLSSVHWTYTWKYSFFHSRVNLFRTSKILKWTYEYFLNFSSIFFYVITRNLRQSDDNIFWIHPTSYRSLLSRHARNVWFIILRYCIISDVNRKYPLNRSSRFLDEIWEYTVSLQQTCENVFRSCLCRNENWIRDTSKELQIHVVRPSSILRDISYSIHSSSTKLTSKLFLTLSNEFTTPLVRRRSFKKKANLRSDRRALHS